VPHESPEITPLDEAYGHQLVAPRATTVHDSPHWQERCYHLLFADTGLMLNMGRAIWPHAGVRRAFLGASDGSVQRVVRTEVPYVPAPGAAQGPDDAEVGGIRVEAVRPLQEVRLQHESDGLRVDLTWTARFPPVATSPQRVEQEDVVVTDYMNFFQPGRYDGVVELDGRRHEVRDRLGFRDRGWGVRKHEGAPRRGLVLAGFCELPDEALYMIMFETASGRRVLTNGWSIRAGGVDPVVEIEHELAFDQHLLSGGTVLLRLASGASRRVRVEPRSRLFLAGVGYSTDPELTAPGAAAFDVTDPAVREALRGQTDHGCRFDVDGVPGHGYVETGLGVHARYRPASA
jgi:hypothetical protein